MSKYGPHVSLRQTPQSERADSAQVENQAGGYSYKASCWTRLDRFLILGTEGGTYYASARKATGQAFGALTECLAENGIRAVDRIVEISLSGRAPKNTPAIAALAYSTTGKAPLPARKLALESIPQVCRTGTHLFEFVDTVSHFRGFGSGLKRGINDWYLGKNAGKLAYQLVKYQQRDGWSHRDVLRKSHASGGTPAQSAALRWAVSGMKGMGPVNMVRREGGAAAYPAVDVGQHLPEIIEAFERAKGERDPKVVARLILEHGLTHEMVPNEVKGSVDVWAALLENMPLTAMIRNLGKMTSIGLLRPFSAAVRIVAERMASTEAVKRARIHPLGVLTALITYNSGKGVKGSLTWDPVSKIVEALNDLFYASFDNVVPTGKNTLLALDVSGSMGPGWGPTNDNFIAGMPGITPRIGSAAMAMITAKTEPNYECMAFCRQFVKVRLTPSMSLDEIVKSISDLPFGGTDCSLPMQWAEENRVEVDCFQIYTDSETWAGTIHPHQALEQYRRRFVDDAKLIVVGMVSNDFTIANPADPGMLDVVGFDTASPRIMADFARGEL